MLTFIYRPALISLSFLGIVAVQQKDTPLSTSTSAVTLVSSSPASVAIMAASSVGSAATSSPAETDLYIPTASADVAADIAKYTNKVSGIFWFLIEVSDPRVLGTDWSRSRNNLD